MEMHPGKQLFIDDFFIESMVGAHRVLNCPEKIAIDEPLHTVDPDRSWESAAVQGPIIYGEKNHTFRLYYTGVNSLMCVLESSDGVHWERPNLGLVEFEGSKDNNILNWPSDCLQLGNSLYDPHETDETCRWKRITTMPHNDVWQALYSADGYNWCHYPAGSHRPTGGYDVAGSLTISPRVDLSALARRSSRRCGRARFA